MPGSKVLIMAGVVSLLVMAGTAQAADQLWGQWQNTLKPRGRPAPEIALAVAGKTEYVIVIPAKPTTQDQKAAEELAQWLGEMTGTSFPVVSDSQPAQDKEISVGHTNRLAAAHLSIAKLDLGEEGYAIAQQGQRLFLLGGKRRGAINAALALLEEDLGCRWYTSGRDRHEPEHRIPRRPTLRVGIVPRSFVPKLGVRDPFWWDAFEGNWSLHNRTNASPFPAAVPQEWGGNTRMPSVHSFYGLVPPGEYFAEHPEYFAEIGGVHHPSQPCLTNPDVVRIATESARQWLRSNPQAQIISVSQNDTSGYCTCANCRALDEAEGSHAGTLINFVNQVAEELEKEFPHVLVSTLAYTYTAILPKHVRPRHNVIIQMCTDTCMWSRPFVSIKDDHGPIPLDWPYWEMVKDPKTLSCRQFVLDWTGISPNVYIWDYVTNYSNYLGPMPNMDVIADNIRFFVAHNCKGVMTQANYQSPGGENSLLRSWVTAKLLWDPSLDVWSLMEDFIWGYYGKAAPAVAEYNAALRQTAAEHSQSLKDIGSIRYPMTAEFLTPEFIEQSTGLFARGCKLAENEEILHRVELAGLPIIYVKIMRGPEYCGQEYLPLIDEFERIARREGITHLAEGEPDLDTKLAKWREDWQIHQHLGQIQDQSTIVPLANEWRFAPDPQDVGTAQQWFAVGLDDSHWAKVRSDTGNGWEHQGFPDYTGYGWYRQQFSVPADLAGAHVYLYFGAIDEDAWIYLNGQLALDHSCAATGLTPNQIWTTPILFDPGVHLKRGQLNTLAVRGHNSGGMGGVWQPAYVVGAEEPLSARLVQALIIKVKSAAAF